MSGNNAQTRVAIMAASEQNHSHLSALLADAGLEVVLQEVPGEHFISQLEQTSADVLLVDLSEDTDSEVDIIDTLLEYDSLPVLFNDSSKAGGETNALWAKKLARRLEQMVREFEPVINDDPAMTLETESETVLENESGLAVEPVVEELVTAERTSGFSLELEPAFELESKPETLLEPEVTLAQQSSPESGNKTELELVVDLEDQTSHEQANLSLDAETYSTIKDEISEEIESLSKPNDSALVAVNEESSLTDLPEGAAVNVWVLGASLGGPQAVRQFLMAIREDLPVAFVLAQHIGENHISLLAEQLDRIAKFKVFPGYNGHMIRHHEVILAPAGKNIHITDDGYISLSDQEENAIYSPCINDVMTAVAKRYGNMAGTIVFSGMGDDGAIGCQSVADNGGIVWAQDVDSCVISSMPDQARKTNNVTFSANPRRLADELYKYYMN